MTLKHILFAGAAIALSMPQAHADGIETVVVTARPPDPVGNDAFLGRKSIS